MSSAGSVTHWLHRLPTGDPAAAEHLWQRYFRQLVRLALRKLHGAPRRLADEEDVALSAFDSFFRGAEKGRFPDLNDRDGLWRLLVVMTRRKAAHLKRDECRQKRGGGGVVDQAALAGAAGEEEAGLDWLAGEEPTPEFAAQLAEECERLLGRLGDPGLRSLAVWKMEGYTNEEIAARLGCCLSTVERRLQLIRRLWSEGDTDDGSGREGP